MDVRRVGGHAADLRQQHAEARIALEEVLDGDVERRGRGVLLLDRLGDHRRVGRQGAGVVGDHERAALRRDVLDALDLAAEPEAVEEVGDRAVEEALDALRAAPVVERAVGLDGGQERAEVLVARRRGAAAVPPSCGSARRPPRRAARTARAPALMRRGGRRRAAARGAGRAPASRSAQMTSSSSQTSCVPRVA